MSKNMNRIYHLLSFILFPIAFVFNICCYIVLKLGLAAKLAVGNLWCPFPTAPPAAPAPVTDEFAYP